MRNQPHKLTSADIALLAGVSRSTVSRVVNGYANVPELTRRRVLEVIQQHGYYPSVTGKTLRGMQSHCVGVFINEAGFSDTAQAELLYAFSDRAQRHGYMTLSAALARFGTPECSATVRKVLYSGCVDAGIFLDATNGDLLIDQLLHEGQTIGALGLNRATAHDRLYTVEMDAQVARRTLDYALSLGYRQVALLCGKTNAPGCRALCADFLKTAQALGIRALCPEHDDQTCLDQQIANVLDKLALPAMLICVDQASVFAAYRTVAARGFRVGTEASILGMGLFPSDLPLWPTLTCFRFNPRELIASLADRLIDGLEGAENIPRHGQIEYLWTPGESCVRNPSGLSV